jgi:RNA polymerase sigma-70 factor (ECF subfamily)
VAISSENLDEIRPLIASCLRGDQAAMVALVQRFQGQVFGLCLRMLGQRQDAEDAAQETFVRVLRNLHQWDAARDFEPWLLAIAGNRCRTAMANRLRRSPNEILPDELPDRTPSSDPARQLAEEVELALETVRPEYRQAFLLFHEQELTYADIAKAMQVPLGTVKTWVHRARQQLIERLRQRGAVGEVCHALPPV